jgi:hypothetical protein
MVIAFLGIVGCIIFLGITVIIFLDIVNDLMRPGKRCSIAMMSLEAASYGRRLL